MGNATQETVPFWGTIEMEWEVVLSFLIAGMCVCVWLFSFMLRKNDIQLSGSCIAFMMGRNEMG